ncbi:MAG: SDR family oxidoreductase [Spirochaetaceae bacterium]|nr:SDR family oxidoreductase [Spirochaetaceae bacterium]
MASTILVTGGAGFLGANILMQAGRETCVHALDLAPLRIGRKNLVWHALDLSDQEALKRLFHDLRPNAVIHTAALSDIDFCEANPEKAEAVNVDASLRIAELCKSAGARLIYFSSDSVFDGKKGWYAETDALGPINQYARTKVAAEAGIARICSDHVIIRPSLIMGLPVLESGNSFLWRLIQSLKSGIPSGFPSAEIRTPVDVITLSRATLECAAADFTGPLHLAGNDRLSRYEIGLRIARALGYDEALIMDKKPEIATGRALRPADASLDNARARSLLATPMKGFDEALRLVIDCKGEKEL